jgi:transcriptional regulator of heat shock response
MSEEKEYDVVLDTLQKKYDVLWKMTQQNVNSGMFNIMDQIRFEQMDQITKAMKLWKDYRERTN